MDIGVLMEDSGIATLPENPEPSEIEGSLRKLASLLQGADSLRRQTAREAAISTLKERNVRGAAGLVDAAFAQVRGETADDDAAPSPETAYTEDEMTLIQCALRARGRDSGNDSPLTTVDGDDVIVAFNGLADGQSSGWDYLGLDLSEEDKERIVLAARRVDRDRLGEIASSPALHAFRARWRRASVEDVGDFIGSSLFDDLRVLFPMMPEPYRRPEAEKLKEIGVSPSNIRALLVGFVPTPRTSAGSGTQPRAKRDISGRPSRPILTQEDRKIGEGLLKESSILERISGDLDSLGVVGENHLRVGIHIVATSRLLMKPLSAEIVSPSSSGKSYVSEKNLALIPPEGKLAGTSFSDQALYYFEEDRLVHVVVFHSEKSRGDREEKDGMGSPFREMISTGQLRKIVTIDFETHEITRDGPIAFLETTTDTERFREDATRLIRFYADDSEAQTKKIHERLLWERTAEGVEHGKGAETVIRRHHAMQRILAEEARGLRVVLPEDWRGITFPTSDLATRRLYAAFLGMIQTIALLRIRHRKIVTTDYGDRILMADREDAEAARDYFLPVLQRAISLIDDKHLGYFDRIKDAFGADCFKRVKVDALLGMSKGGSNAVLRKLANAELLDSDGESGKAYIYTVRADADPQALGKEGAIGFPWDSKPVDLTHYDTRDKPASSRSEAGSDRTDRLPTGFKPVNSNPANELDGPASATGESEGGEIVDPLEGQDSVSLEAPAETERVSRAGSDDLPAGWEEH